jgi:hypothetical protein
VLLIIIRRADGTPRRIERISERWIGGRRRCLERELEVTVLGRTKLAELRASTERLGAEASARIEIEADGEVHGPALSLVVLEQEYVGSDELE